MERTCGRALIQEDVECAGAALLALCSLSTRRRPVEIGVVVVAYAVASQTAVALYPVEMPPASAWLQLAFSTLTAGTAVAVGAAIGARRVEVRSLRERAESAEREQAARAAQARAMERNWIAREMHDVLAHRISLVAMQAGVLDRRRDLSAEENQVLIRGIADGSQQALARVIAAATGPQSSEARRATRRAARERLSVLTERELDTARAIADGLANPQIAERLHISTATVKAHTSSLFTKLALENRVQIALLVRDVED
ncbi:helix-turn-helix transcriptional regulator [Saccharopolyspora antimicrobica]|uniref:helix-turn-helix transcriptional regulator n=1 Tax=Saccharopolyspora antimicrobica TaxID=455193 RepID=UPI001FE89F09|nr:LuxR C-terminal-related transcriptional regulator [Saccharopolyspora antimicrobica]